MQTEDVGNEDKQKKKNYSYHLLIEIEHRDRNMTFQLEQTVNLKAVPSLKAQAQVPRLPSDHSSRVICHSHIFIAGSAGSRFLPQQRVPRGRQQTCLILRMLM